MSDINEAKVFHEGNKSRYFVYIGLLVFLVLVRLPSLFFSVFDWDESTFILMGQNMLNGNIPYVTAWDMKPPGAFAIYAMFIALFGKSLAAVRIGGMICIYIASLFIYESGKIIRNRTAGIIAALFLIVFVSSGISGLSTMIEHILLVPVSWGLYLLIVQKITVKTAFFTGLLFGAGILTKTSLAFESLAVLLLVAYGRTNPGSPFTARMKQCAIMGLGMVIPIFAILSYYGIHNELALFLRTNVSGLFLYTASIGTSLSEKVWILFSNIRDNIELNPLLWMTFIPYAIYYVFKKQKEPESMVVPFVFFIFQMVALFVTAQPYGYHYLFTSMPAMSLVSGVFLSKWVPERRKQRAIYHLALLTLLGLGFFYSLQGSVVKYYGELHSNLVEKRPPGDDTCSRIARFLNAEGVKDHYIYMVNSCQIVYWLTGSRCPTKYIHPSVFLVKDYLIKIIDGPGASRETELQSLLKKDPQFIVSRNDLWAEDLHTIKDLLDAKLRSDYELVKTVDAHYEIYMLKENSKETPAGLR